MRLVMDAGACNGLVMEATHFTVDYCTELAVFRVLIWCYRDLVLPSHILISFIPLMVWAFNVVINDDCFGKSDASLHFQVLPICLRSLWMDTYHLDNDTQGCEELGITALHIKLHATGGNKTKTPDPDAQSALRPLACLE
ncbi:hypothetical protein HHK36_007228 [Tetracentron sinense]|uniref:Uncharacterized protein n=1 Tax=Tetracentron sinense TaxID=13715 RepID=A0A834ZKJ9_TETSI|nr:hypothetical protein HHK36_007228 [Tetracentron sinense]